MRIPVVLCSLALAWSLVLIAGAFAVPVYSGSSTTCHPASPGQAPTCVTTSTSATLVEVNGAAVVALVALPALASLLVLGSLLIARAGQTGAGAAAWVVVALLWGFAILGAFSIGMFVVPAAVLLTLATAVGRRVPRAAGDVPAAD